MPARLDPARKPGLAVHQAAVIEFAQGIYLFNSQHISPGLLYRLSPAPAHSAWLGKLVLRIDIHYGMGTRWNQRCVRRRGLAPAIILDMLKGHPVSLAITPRWIAGYAGNLADPGHTCSPLLAGAAARRWRARSASGRR
jgi:hypothetical protein